MDTKTQASTLVSKKSKVRKQADLEVNRRIDHTDEYCTKEITSYKKAIHIEKAIITQAMLQHHKEAVRIVKDDPHLVSKFAHVNEYLTFVSLMSSGCTVTVHHSFNHNHR
jgi:hypothetical protein